MKWMIGQEHRGMNVRDYLRQVQGFSRRMLIAIKHQEEGGILVNEIPVTVRFLLSEGDEIEVIFPEEEKGPLMKAEDLRLKIVYEDDAIIVIDKQPFMATLPSRHHLTGTLANGVLGHYERKGLTNTVHVVTRLDRNTSGLVLIAKNSYSHSIMAETQKAGSLSRKYQAIIEGDIKKDQGTIHAPIDRKEDSIIERMVKNTGKDAITHFHVLDRLADHSFVEIELETGRTHQIRVHFSHIGHPLAGDDLYGGHTDHMKRHALHCFELEFQHPLRLEKLKVRSELPEDMKQLLTKLRSHS